MAVPLRVALLFSLLLALTLAPFPSSPIAAQGTVGRISGYVKHAVTGGGLQAVVSGIGPVSWSRTTNANGYYQYRAPAGTYKVTAVASGFAPKSITAMLPAGVVTVVSFTLQPTGPMPTPGPFPSPTPSSGPSPTPTPKSSPTPTPTPTPGGVWKPGLVTSWQWQLTTPIDQSVNVQMYDIDLFDNAATVVAALHTAGRKVVCYISAGTWEDWRPDAAAFPESVKGQSNGWPGERWLDIRQLSILQPIMSARLDVCKAKGFDGVEFDNVDGYSNNSGFPLTGAQQITYNTWLAGAAHARGLSAGLKNDVEQVVALLPHFDWVLNEECFTYNECSLLLPFINAGKAVFHVEYSMPTSQFCAQANAMNFNSMKKNLSLNAFREPCR